METSGERTASDYGFFSGPPTIPAPTRSPEATKAAEAAPGGYQPTSFAFPADAQAASYGVAPAPVPAYEPVAAYTPTATLAPAAPLAPAPLQVAAPEVPDGAYSRATTEAAADENDVNLNDLLDAVIDRGASDLHLTAGAQPMVRRHGELEPLDEYPVLDPPMIQRVLYAALTQKQREKFEEKLELDFSYSLPGRARFRVNLYRQRESLGAAFRIIPFKIRQLEELGVPPVVSNFAMLPRGFVLVTGPTGSGKSTTLASLIDSANRNRRGHIMTCEDPIEFLHEHKGCIVNQREVGEDTWSFANALKHVLRQDPDIILVGEMRDLETISVALTAAETGHLVFGTLHTSDAAQTVDRTSSTSSRPSSSSRSACSSRDPCRAWFARPCARPPTGAGAPSPRRCS